MAVDVKAQRKSRRKSHPVGTPKPPPKPNELWIRIRRANHRFWCDENGNLHHERHPRT
jgi:hypothetical protein